MKTELIKNFRSEHEVLIAPMSKKELRENLTKTTQLITAKVSIGLFDLIVNGVDWLNDEVSEKITGSIAGLTDIDYTLIGRTTTNEVILKVVANVEFENL